MLYGIAIPSIILIQIMNLIYLRKLAKQAQTMQPTRNGD